MDHQLTLYCRGNMDVTFDSHLWRVCEGLSGEIYYKHPDDQIIGIMKKRGREIGYLIMSFYNHAFSFENQFDLMAALQESEFEPVGKALLANRYGGFKPEIMEEIGVANSPNFLVIADFGIFTKYRGKGLGKAVLQRLIQQMHGRCGYIALVSIPPQHDPDCLLDTPELEKMDLDLLEPDPEKAQRQLNAFFQQCGFQPLKNYPGIFVCNVEQTVARHLPDMGNTAHPLIS